MEISALVAGKGKWEFLELDRYAPWYCGSSVPLTHVPFAMPITQIHALARAFSHKPSLVVLDQANATVRHNGRLGGYLYRVIEPVTKAHITAVPGSALPPGAEWWAQRPFRIEFVEQTVTVEDELLTPEEETAMRMRIAARR